MKGQPDELDPFDSEPVASPVASHAAAPLVPLSFQGAPALRERLSRDLREKFSLTAAALDAAGRAAAPPPSVQPQKSAPAGGLCPHCGVNHDEEHDEVDVGLDDLDDDLAVLVDRSAHELAAMIRRFPEKERRLFSALPAETLLHFFCLSSKARKKALERSHDMRQFVANVLATRSFSNDGADFLDGLDFIDETDCGLMRTILREHGVDWQGAQPAIKEEKPPKAPEPRAAAQPPAAPPTDEPAGVIRDKKPLGDWLRRRSRGDVAWLELQTSEGALRGQFAIDGVQARGKEIALLVSADWMERGRVVYEREILAAAEAPALSSKPVG